MGSIYDSGLFPDFADTLPRSSSTPFPVTMRQQWEAQQAYTFRLVSINDITQAMDKLLSEQYNMALV